MESNTQQSGKFTHCGNSVHKARKCASAPKNDLSVCSASSGNVSCKRVSIFLLCFSSIIKKPDLPADRYEVSDGLI